MALKFQQLFPRLHRITTIITRSKTSQITAGQDDVIEEVISVHGFDPLANIQERPLQSLGIAERIPKLEKAGSFTVDFFLGKFDHSYLTYPDPLNDKLECKKLVNQAAMVRQMWPKIWNNDEELQRNNFFNLYQLSVTEMVSIFEAIGSSSRYYFDSSLATLNSTTSAVLDSSAMKHYDITKSILSLITRNCLTYWPISKSKNQELKDRFLPKRHILYGGMADELNPLTPIAFAWSEKAYQLGTQAPQEWTTIGSRETKNSDNFCVVGKKEKILVDDNSDYFMVYYRDSLLSKQYDDILDDSEPNPATDPFIGACIVHSSEISNAVNYTDSTGFTYRDIEIDRVLANSREVFPATRNSPFPLNIKGLGQLATCAVEMGILKSSLQRTYRYLLEHRPGLLTCDIVQQKLSLVTSKIFALESMVYYIAGMYDGLADGFDAHIEAAMLKVATIKFGYEILQDLQQLTGSESLVTSKMQDQLNIFDSFLDGAIYNQVYISTMGILWFLRNNNVSLNKLRLSLWYPGHTLRTAISNVTLKSSITTLDADIIGEVHPSLRKAGLNLEFLLKNIKYAANLICRCHGGNTLKAQTELSRVSRVATDSFMLVAVLARASKTYSNALKNSEIDVALANIFSEHLVNKLQIDLVDLERSPLERLDSMSKIISDMNLKNGGFFAANPLDPNI